MKNFFLEVSISFEVQLKQILEYFCTFINPQNVMNRCSEAYFLSQSVIGHTRITHDTMLLSVKLKQHISSFSIVWLFYAVLFREFYIT